MTASSAATMDSISAATSGVALLPLSVLAHSCTSRRFRCSTVAGAPASSAFVDDPRTTTRRRWRPVAEGVRAMSREGAWTRADDGGAALARDMSPRIPELPTGCDDADRTSPSRNNSEHDLQSPVRRVARPAERARWPTTAAITAAAAWMAPVTRPRGPVSTTVASTSAAYPTPSTATTSSPSSFTSGASETTKASRSR